MIRQTLSIHGGGVLEIHGTPEAREIVLMLCRDDFRKDDPLFVRVVDYFTARQHTVMRYETERTVTARLIDPSWLWGLPSSLRRIGKALLLLTQPARWRYFSPRYRAATASIEYRSESLRALMGVLGREKRIFLVAHSASGRVASLIADEVCISKLVCLGYPFQHPERGPEPARYAHLPGVQTPMLIIQGVRDAYGGAEILEKYRFSATTNIEIANTDHSLSATDEEMARILALIDAFFGAKPPQAHEQANGGADSAIIFYREP